MVFRQSDKEEISFLGARARNKNNRNNDYKDNNATTSEEPDLMSNSIPSYRRNPNTNTNHKGLPAEDDDLMSAIRPNLTQREEPKAQSRLSSKGSPPPKVVARLPSAPKAQKSVQKQLQIHEELGKQAQKLLRSTYASKYRPVDPNDDDEHPDPPKRPSREHSRKISFTEAPRKGSPRIPESSISPSLPTRRISLERRLSREYSPDHPSRDKRMSPHLTGQHSERHSSREIRDDSTGALSRGNPRSPALAENRFHGTSRDRDDNYSSSDKHLRRHPRRGRRDKGNYHSPKAGFPNRNNGYDDQAILVSGT
ncbi:unnamed protein product [Ambrosiozyma monospora]|uniref:Unnamed protein product n=1 Tax=Ambrosiozyma monospora TaxID=43982 RepID=A0ACB5TQD3_AMBMO|nr:unnamed protein product [Ambrosiozyma monospora]